MSRATVYLDGYPYTYRPRNSDWSYVEKKMPRVADWAPSIQFVLQRSRAVSLRANYKAIRAAIRRRMGCPISLMDAETDILDARELADSGCSMVFSHRQFPMNCSHVPVIWMNAIVDPEMTSSYFGYGQAEMDEEIAVKSVLYRKAAVVQVCTKSEVARHVRTFPDIADRFVDVPLFGPHLQSAPESVIEKHRNPSPVRLLFVGNEARRKGLQETLDAYTSLSGAMRQATSFTIVSHFDRSSITIPDDPRITVHRGLPQAEVLELMRTSHLLLNVAHFESYGMVFLEAMSQGTLCLGPDWETHRELFDNGLAGINMRCEVGLIRSAMKRAIEDEEYRIALASAGWQRFNERYAPAVVAARYADLFCAATARSL